MILVTERRYIERVERWRGGGAAARANMTCWKPTMPFGDVYYTAKRRRPAGASHVHSARASELTPFVTGLPRRSPANDGEIHMRWLQ